jgi:hypothetical protein
MIDLYTTCDSIATLICNALVMFMFYSWIKIKLKVLIFPTIEPPSKTEVGGGVAVSKLNDVLHGKRWCYVSVSQSQCKASIHVCQWDQDPPQSVSVTASIVV